LLIAMILRVVLYYYGNKRRIQQPLKVFAP